MTSEETIFEARDGIGRIRLNRPQVLNALSPRQFAAIDRQLAAWAADAAVRVVLIEGTGDRAFCAGGDLRPLWEGREGGREVGRALFSDEYRLDRRIFHYTKPYVALMDGIVMGGGAGVSVNGRFRVAGETTLFAMPETAIGFFPDVGATHFLTRLPGCVGLYLGLTGARLGPADCLWAGLATHYVPRAGRAAMAAGLVQAAAAADPTAAVAEVLAAHHRDPGASTLAERRAAIDRCFGRPSLAEIRTALADEPGDWAAASCAALAGHSPTALAVTFRQLTGGAGLGFDEAIRREYRITTHMLEGGDLYEGIRAAVVDKDRRPRWNPADTADVADETVAAYFRPPAGGDLDLG